MEDDNDSTELCLVGDSVSRWRVSVKNALLCWPVQCNVQVARRSNIPASKESKAGCMVPRTGCKVPHAATLHLWCSCSPTRPRKTCCCAAACSAPQRWVLLLAKALAAVLKSMCWHASQTI